MFRLIIKRMKYEIVNGDIADAMMVLLILLGITFVICGFIALIVLIVCTIIGG